MAALSSFNDYLARSSGGYSANVPFCDQIDAATTSSFSSGQLINIQKFPSPIIMPSLPSGVTGYRLTNVSLYASTAGNYMLAKLIDMGSLNIATPTFTDGSAMPTKTEGNASNATASSIIAEVTTVFSAAPGNFTVTYVDQDGNTAETTASVALTASAAVKTCGYVTLNGTDWGARDVTSATRTAGTTPTGVFKLWGVLPVCNLSIHSTPTASQQNFLTSNITPPLLGAGDQLHFFCLGSTTAKHIHGTLSFVGDQA